MPHTSYSIEEMFSALLQGIQVNEEQKNLLVDLYWIGLYKIILEALIGIKGSEGTFQKELVSLFDKHFKILNEEEKRIYDKVTNKHKNLLIKQIIDVVALNLPQKEKEVLAKNIKEVFKD